MQIDMNPMFNKYWSVSKCDVTAYQFAYACVKDTLVCANIILAEDKVASLPRGMGEEGRILVSICDSPELLSR